MRSASRSATREPDAFVQNIDSCIDGLAFLTSGLISLVVFLTLSCRPPVTRSMHSEAASNTCGEKRRALGLVGVRPG